MCGLSGGLDLCPAVRSLRRALIDVLDVEGVAARGSDGLDVDVVLGADVVLLGVIGSCSQALAGH